MEFQILCTFEKARSKIYKMNKVEREKLLKQISWDYNLSEADILALLEGRLERAGHYTRKDIFRKLLETYPWFTILNIMPAHEVKELLSDQVISSLRSHSLKQKYEFIKRRLEQVV